MKKWLKKYFIPHEENNHHPHFWHDNSIKIIFTLVLIIEIAVLSQSYLLFKSDSFLATILPKVLASLTNEERNINNLASLTTNPLLEQAAKLKAEDMAKRGYFAHNTPEGFLPWYWLEKVGYSYASAGENLAVNFSDSEDVVNSWMNSPLHRDNILKQKYTEIGIGMAEGTYKGRSTIFVVQFFGTPAITATVTAPENPKPANIVATTTNNASDTLTIIPAQTEVLGTSVNENSVVNILVASPRNTGSAILYILLTLILIAFLLAVLIKIKIQHKRIIIIGLLLIIMIISILFFNTIILKEAVIIAENSNSVI